jgi:prepilin-type N-terminal cleavage/methylation domain-containing protein
MQMNKEFSPSRSAGRAGFTLAEVMVAVGVMAVMLLSLYLGISNGFSVVQRTRENLRATQILVQRVETLRLYTWDQLLNSGATPTFQTNFSDLYNPLSVTNGTGSGVAYFGDIQVTVPPPATALPASVSYRANVALVTVSLRWTNGSGASSIPHLRQFETLVAKSGMQQYVYGAQ